MSKSPDDKKTLKKIHKMQGAVAMEDEAGPEASRTASLAAQDLAGLFSDFKDQTTQAATRFNTMFEQRVKRWETMIGIMMVVMIIAVGGGAYMIYQLGQDMRQIASRFDPKMSYHMGRLSSNMEELSQNIGTMTFQVQQMSRRVQDMSKDTSKMAKKMDHLAAMDSINLQVTQMNRSIQLMTANVGHMQNNVASMNQSVSRPMSFFNSFMPW